MILSIRHETRYRYTEPIGYTIQNLRLTPRDEPYQRVLSWSVSTPGQLRPFTDAFGNPSHILTVTVPHQEVRIVVEGRIETMPLDRGRLDEQGAMSPLVFTIPTRLTQPDDAIRALTARALTAGATHAAEHQPSGEDFVRLAQVISAEIAYETGATAVDSTAAEALRIGRGVCQDHAHLFIACCHVAGVPARYVSGYIETGQTQNAESHAWVDVWVEEPDYTGWVAIDVTHASFQAGNLCRLAVGRDYDSAAPVRGIRRGGGNESLFVDVQVRSSVNQ